MLTQKVNERERRTLKNMNGSEQEQKTCDNELISLLQVETASKHRMTVLVLVVQSVVQENEVT